MRKSVLLATAVAMVALSAPAGAKDDQNFYSCDRYAAPKETDDKVLGAPSGAWPISAAGNTACDAALADPRLLETHWIRRAHIREFKALHLIATSNFTEALAQVDLSDREIAGKGNAWVESSIGTANAMIRAVILYRLDRKPDARKALDAAVASRPWSSTVARAARSIRMLFEYDREAVRQSMLRTAPLSPALIENVFWLSIFSDDFKTAERLGTQISLNLPKGHGGWQMVGNADYQFSLIKDRAEIAGGLAYAKLALGKRDEAMKILADARSDIADAIDPPQPDAQGNPPDKRVMAAWEARKRMADAGAALLNQWERAMTLRTTVSGKSLAAAMIMIGEANGKEMITLSDILAQVKPANDAERASVKKLIEEFDRGKDRAAQRTFALNVTQLVAMLPTPEKGIFSSKKLPVGAAFEGSAGSGSVDKSDAAGLVLVHFETYVGTAPLAEEIVLLKAARYAQAQGKPAFIIDWAKTIARQSTISGYRTSYTIDSGFEVQMKIRPVDPAALPPEFELQRWRVIRADEIVAALGPKYPVNAPPK